MIIVRSSRPEKSYTILRNDVLRDQRLSYRARGVLTYILSHSDNWRTSADSLAEHGKEGRQAIYTALRELTVAGYIEYRRSQDPATGRWQTETLVFDVPQTAPVAEGVIDKKKSDPAMTAAAKLVADIWEPAMKGKTAQPAVAVVRILATAIRNGVDQKKLTTALKAIVDSKQTVTTNRIDEALNGKPKRGKLAADKKADWSSLNADADGVAPF
jgi:hypothetical protein